METKICNNCNATYEYNPKKRLSICHECHLKKRREQRLAKKPDLAKHFELKNAGNQECKNCIMIKSTSDFRKNRRICMDCEKVSGRNYRKSATGSTKAKQWSENNTELHKSLQAKWYQENKQIIYDKWKHRMETDTQFKFLKTCRDRLRQVIKKDKSTCEYLGCNKELLVKWLTFNFTSDMNIQNHGTYWHIDHVIPLASESEPFDVERLHWSNLSPYRADLNLSKHNSIDKDQLKSHIDSLQKFIHIENINLETKYIDLFARHLNNGKSLTALTTISS